MNAEKRSETSKIGGSSHLSRRHFPTSSHRRPPFITVLQRPVIATILTSTKSLQEICSALAHHAFASFSAELPPLFHRDSATVSSRFCRSSAFVPPGSSSCLQLELLIPLFRHLSIACWSLCSASVPPLFNPRLAFSVAFQSFNSLSLFCSNLRTCTNLSVVPLLVLIPQ
ncbi:hypothetical protein HN51_002855 [Arachis hypogaea]|nr:uncharacterized protein LOC112706262 [Arachis hypogaea]QHO51104.1 uncharacterized protein DS421_1g28040 [Arachis hypogaea]